MTLRAGTACAARRQDRGCAVVRRAERHAADARRRGRRSGAAPARSPADGPGDRVRLPSHHDRGGAAVARPDRRERRRSGRAGLRQPCRECGRRRCGSARREVLGGRPRPPVPRLARRVGVPRSVERTAGRAERPRRPAGQRCDPDAARACGARGRAGAGRSSADVRDGRTPGGPARGSTTSAAPSPRRAVAPRAHAGDRAPGAAVRSAGRHGVRLPLRPRAPPAGHRLQRRRAPAGSELLRPARLRRRGSRASSRLRRASCRRRTGSRSGACSPPPGASRCSCPGAARCSST